MRHGEPWEGAGGSLLWDLPEFSLGSSGCKDQPCKGDPRSVSPPCIHLRRGSIAPSIQASFCLKSRTPPLFNSSSSFPTCSQCPPCPFPPPPSSSWEQPHRDWANPLSYVVPAPSPGPYSLPSPWDLGGGSRGCQSCRHPQGHP